MNRANEKRSRLQKMELMERILQVRYTDIEEEKRLCKELLGIAEPNQDIYNCAFAHVYLLDSFLALGDYDNCAYHLIRAEELCRENRYDELLVSLCNFAGLYYCKMNNDKAAVRYHIEGIEIAEKLGDDEMKGKHYNNLGLVFGYREDWAMARSYFERAANMVERNITPDNVSYVVSCLCNLAETSKETGDHEEMRRILEKCDALNSTILYHKIRIATGWMSYYASVGDKKNCLRTLKTIMEEGFLEHPDKLFISFMLEGMTANLLEIGERKAAKRYMDILDSMRTETTLANRYHIQAMKIRYWKDEGNREAYGKALKEYYEIMKQMSVMDDETRIQSMVSQIEIVRTRRERQNMRNENVELERLTQMDSLTGLYNRRYLNKLTTKMMQSEELTSLGYVMLDVDYFKQYNDFYGHFNGDKVLMEVAHVLKEAAGENIFAGRYGGDEFVCLCVNITDDEMTEYVGKVIEEIAKRNIDHEKSPCGGKLTLSIGYHNERVEAGIRPEDIMNTADRALYKAKQAGRNSAAKL